MSVGDRDTVAAQPARLFCILARRAPVGVVLRRGPTRWVQCIKWRTRDDKFERGQWFRGRIYERRCDLSPDGSLFVYFASKQGPGRHVTEGYTNSWTAVSKPPYLTALALWPKGDTWYGGGLFESDQALWLHHWPEQAMPHPSHPPRGLRVVPNLEAAGEDWPIYYRRLERDGWVCRQAGKPASKQQASRHCPAGDLDAARPLGPVRPGDAVDLE